VRDDGVNQVSVMNIISGLSAVARVVNSFNLELLLREVALV